MNNASDTTRLGWLMWLSLVLFGLSVLAAAGVGVMMIVRELNFVKQYHPLVTALITLCISVFTLMCGWFSVRRHMVVLMHIATAAIVVAGGLSIWLVWADPATAIQNTVILIIGTLVLLVMIVLVQAGFGDTPVSNEPFADDPSVQRLRIAARWVLTGACAALLVLGWMGPIMYPAFSSDAQMALNACLVLLFLAGVILAGMVPVRMRALRRRHMTRRETLARDAALGMTCPNCGHEQTCPQGHAKCPKCRFEMFIELEEPRCACGYVLYQLPTGTCPECGRDVPAGFVVDVSDPA